MKSHLYSEEKIPKNISPTDSGMRFGLKRQESHAQTSYRFNWHTYSLLLERSPDERSPERHTCCHSLSFPLQTLNQASMLSIYREENKMSGQRLHTFLLIVLQIPFQFKFEGEDN
ncbi:hypothetical protein CEXT_42031 [Caerostris extrusa]|uniref:Ycf15 n=1 Tax=Caerostris extrusa TaxID=172846 RepID=A0AAV4W348_CAEEX|nr:hypothetical protein CEXT_42031 [Caerostris extrusa]